jgi:hypothetical protein
MLRKRLLTATVAVAAVWITVVAPAFAGAPDAAANAAPDSVTVRITNRMYPQFLEIVTVAMNQELQIGDTDYYFALTDFYPHFAYLDSSKTYVSLSDELENPAFRVQVWEGEDELEKTWAFFLVDVPHFSRESFLAFQVLEFRYRGETHTRKSGEEGKGGDRI